MKKLLPILAAALFALFYPAAVHAGEGLVVKAEGVAGKMEDGAPPKDRAVGMALRGAVAEAADAVMKRESIEADKASLEAEVYSRASSFILNYRVLSEGWITHMDGTITPPGMTAEEAAANRAANGGGLELYHIWVEASIDAEGLKGALTRMSSKEGSPSAVTLVLVDVPDYGSFRSLLDSLGRIAMLRDLAYDTFYRNEITLKARYAGGLQALSERIAGELEGGYTVAPLSWGKLVIKAKAKQEKAE